MVRRFRKVAVGGTFDNLHEGHSRLLGKALEMGDLVVIGVTTDEMLRVHPKNHLVAKFDERQRNLLSFLTDLGVVERVQIVPITDKFGPVIYDAELDALVVSRETCPVGKEINEIRSKRGYAPMKLIVIDLVLADDGLPISTTRIRRGKIDRDGRLVRSEEAA